MHLSSRQSILDKLWGIAKDQIMMSDENLSKLQIRAIVIDSISSILSNRNNEQLIAVIRETCNKKCDELIGNRPAKELKESLLWEYEPPYEKEYPCTLLIMKDGEYSIHKVANEEEFKQLDYTRWCNVEDIY